MPTNAGRKLLSLTQMPFDGLIGRDSKHGERRTIAASSTVITDKPLLNGAALRISYGLLYQHLHQNIGHG
jgi:hypothetical protein